MKANGLKKLIVTVAAVAVVATPAALANPIPVPSDAQQRLAKYPVPQRDFLGMSTDEAVPIGFPVPQRDYIEIANGLVSLGYPNPQADFEAAPAGAGADRVVVAFPNPQRDFEQMARVAIPATNVTSDGFNFRDAGVGAVIAILAILLATSAALLVRNRQRLAQS